MITPSIYASLRKSGTDGKALVQIICYFKNGDKHYVKISTGLKIGSNDWDEKSHAPTAQFALNNTKWYESLEKKKEEVQQAFNDLYSEIGTLISAETLKGLLVNQKNDRTNGQHTRGGIVTLDQFIRWYIDKQENTPFSKRKSEATIKQYVTTYNRLENYYKATKTKIYLATASMEEVDRCVSWFERQKYSGGMRYAQNTIQDHEKWLIAMVNKAVANRFECPMWNPKQSEGRIAIADTDDIHFDLSDFQKLLNYTPQNGLERNALVWAVIGYCTGLRHSDWERCFELLNGESTQYGESTSRISVHDKEYRFLHMCPSKTRKHLNGKGIWCGIPVLTPVEMMIEKYGLPKPATNQVINRALKEVAVSAGIDESYDKQTRVAGGNIRIETALKGEFATTHKIGRVSFITQFAEFIPKPILVKITAHVGGSRDAFDGYIKDQNLKRNAERFIGMLQDHQDRGEFGEVEFV